METLPQIVILALIMFVALTSILWIVLPFLVMGINKRLDKILTELKHLRHRR